MLYRIAAVLLVLWTIGHTIWFRQGDPQWRAESVIALMRSFHFDVMGFSRTYWDFFVGFGFIVSVFLVFAAVLAWHLGGLSQETLRQIPVVTWSLAICFVGTTVLSWMYFFTLPIIFSSVISLCLILAAWLAGNDLAKA